MNATTRGPADLGYVTPDLHMNASLSPVKLSHIWRWLTEIAALLSGDRKSDHGRAS